MALIFSFLWDVTAPEYNSSYLNVIISEVAIYHSLDAWVPLLK